MRVVLPLEVRYAETDQMGVVHHGVYVVWMEAARVEFLKRLGVPYHELERSGVRLPVVELGVTYRAPAAFGQVVEVSCALEDLSSRAARFRYWVQRDGRVLAEGFTRHVCCDTQGRAVPFPESLRRTLGGGTGSPAPAAAQRGGLRNPNDQPSAGSRCIGPDVFRDGVLQ